MTTERQFPRLRRLRTRILTVAFGLVLLTSLLPTTLASFQPGAPGQGYQADGTWRNALADQLGSPLMYVDTTGVESGLTHYDPYGVPRPGSTGTVGIGFTGEYRDVTGLINLRARSYDPVMGRFIGRDTFAGIASAPQTANRYAYALANPLRYSDPMGRFVNKVLANPVAWATAASVAMPWVGIAWAATIAATGYDPVTGEQVSGEGRAFAAATAALGIFGKVAGAVREAWAATEGIEAAGVSAEARLAGGAFGRAEARVAGDVGGIGRARGLAEIRVTGEAAEVRAGLAVEARGGVYSLRDEAGEVVRTGRSSDLAARKSAHFNDPVLREYRFNIEYRTDIYAEQRGLEQMLYDRHPGAQFENGGFNKIRGISPSNPKRPAYVNAAEDFLERLGT